MSTISVSRPGPDTISLAQPERETISLSMPAIMRNPRVSLAHLHGNKARKASTKAEGKVGKGGVDKREGGQWGGRRAQNRLANSRFADNPSIIRPTLRDYANPPLYVSSFAPPPNPATFPRSLFMAPVALGDPATNAASSASGKFSRSLKGIRRSLRAGRGGRAEDVVTIVEREIREWLDETISGGWNAAPVGERVVDSTLVSESLVPLFVELPDQPPHSSTSPKVLETPAIVEVARSPASIQWLIGDPYTRYIVHCLARYYSLLSFSKIALPSADSTPPRRLTHLLRPHITHPTLSTLQNPFTPPTTDLSASDFTASASEFASSASEIDSSVGDQESEDGDDEDGGWEEVVPDPRHVAVNGETLGRTRTTTSSSDEAGRETDGLSAEDGYSTTDEENDEEENAANGEIESMVSSIASLALPPSPARDTPSAAALTAALLDGAETPTARRVSPFQATETAMRPSRLSNVLGLDALDTSGNATPKMSSRSRAIPRSENSSPSRSPSRLRRPRVSAGTGAAHTGSREVRKSAGGWVLPEKSFAQYVFG